MRQAQRRRIVAQPLVEGFLDAGDAMLVHVDAAEHLGGEVAHRVVALLAGLEVDAGDAEGVDLHLLARRDLAFEVDELLGALGQAL